VCTCVLAMCSDRVVGCRSIVPVCVQLAHVLHFAWIGRRTCTCDGWMDGASDRKDGHTGSSIGVAANNTSGRPGHMQ
jgi:hypothetical protein